MIPKELYELVKEYLTDGIISDKERRVLLRKANKLGIDSDEFDLYLDAQLQKIDKENSDNLNKRRGATCPFCGGQIQQLADTCPHCGQVITVEASEELKEVIEQLEDALTNYSVSHDKEYKVDAERYIRKANLYYKNNPKVKLLISEYQKELSNSELAAKKEARYAVFLTIIKSGFTWGGLLLLVSIPFWIWGETTTRTVWFTNEEIVEPNDTALALSVIGGMIIFVSVLIYLDKYLKSHN